MSTPKPTTSDIRNWLDRYLDDEVIEIIPNLYAIPTADLEMAKRVIDLELLRRDLKHDLGSAVVFLELRVSGSCLSNVLKQLGISESSFMAWKRRYAGRSGRKPKAVKA